MESDKFCLRWNDFETNISTAFRELREDKDFFDVTLACDEDQIQAHKVILSACSPFFKTILKRNRHEHPLLYLKGVKYTDLVAVLNFMYHGEVNVAQEELNTFLSIAEELKIKGLTQNSTPEKSKPETQANSFNKQHQIPSKFQVGPAPKKMKTFPNPPTKKTNISCTSDDVDDDIQEILPVKRESVDSLNTPISTLPVLTSANHQHNAGHAGASNENTALVENSDNSAIYEEDFGEFGDYNVGGEGYEHQNMVQDPNDGNKDEILDTMIESIIVRRMHPLHGVVHECSVCNKVLKKRNKMQQHAEIHLKGFSHQCNFCGKYYKTRPSLKVHISTTHKQEKDTICLESILG